MTACVGRLKKVATRPNSTSSASTSRGCRPCAAPRWRARGERGSDSQAATAGHVGGARRIVCCVDGAAD
eukprot:3701092-Prymnesium_polylepis.1